MNVTCTGCPAKYSVPDDKVRGKKVRITCKHCGANIVVDGSALGAAQSAPSPTEPAAAAPAATRSTEATAGARAPAPAPAPALPEPEPPIPTAASRAIAESFWLVGFSDEQQEQHATSAVVGLYADGKIDDETLVWKDGMADWASPFDIPEIASVMAERGVTRRAAQDSPSSSGDPAPAPDPSPAAPEAVVSSAAAVPQSTPELKPAAALRQSAPELKPAALRQSAPELKPAAGARQSTPEIKPIAAPKAARRAERRPDVDLFGSVANAGSEADVSLDFGVSDEPVHKLTGARNESSVLFSLDALTKPDPKAGQKKAQEKEQEKQAAAALFGDAAPDSLMNVGGGGLAALAAPDFTKPVAASPNPVRPSDPVEVPNAAPAKKKGAAGLIIVTLFGLAAAAGLAFMFLAKKPGSVETPAASSPAAARAVPVAPASEAVAPTASAPTEAVAPTEAASPTASAANAAAPATSLGVAPKLTANPAAAGSGPSTQPLNKPAEKPVDKPTAEPAAAAGPEFNKAAAIAALGAAAASAATCKKPDGPTGGGKASVTFAPSGRATNSTVSGALAGTEVGGCVARIFRSAKVPPFAGDPVTVSKSFSVE